MSSILRATLSTGASIDFSTTPLGSGGEKVAFPSRDGRNVVCFYSNHHSSRADRISRVKNILTTFNITTEKDGELWRPLFCWPTAMIDGGGVPKDFLERHGLLAPALATVCPFYRPNFFFTDIDGERLVKDGKWFILEKSRLRLPTHERGNFSGYLRACLQIARALRRIHDAGIAHSDVSSRNVLIDPLTGEACITDLDSMVIPGVAGPSVQGTPGYIAPEVVAGRALPSILTDRHALAVLLYEILLFRHPLEGTKVHSIASEFEDEKLSMGAKALFIEHPTDHSNPPAIPPLVPFPFLGPHLAPLFHQAFVDGLHDPKKRPTAASWENALCKTQNLLHPSPEAGESFILAPGLPVQCAFSRNPLTAPVPYAHFFRQEKSGCFVPENCGLTISHHTLLQPWHARSQQLQDPAHRTPTRLGFFAFEKNRWLLMNESPQPMQILGGPPIPPGTPAEILPGIQIQLSFEADGRVLAFEFLHP